MNTDYLYDLEYIRSEMELKLNQAKIKANFTGNFTDAEDKIKRLTGVINHLYELYENIEQFNAKKKELEFINKKLNAEIFKQ